VTVVVTCFNHAPYVEHALDQVLAQTHRPIEWIVTDDASTDDTQERVRTWFARNEIEATFVFHTENTGFAPILNEAVPLATGDFFLTTSADDWMAPDRIERQLRRFAEAGPDCALVYSDTRPVDAEGEPVVWFTGRGDRPVKEDAFADLLDKGFIPASTVMMRTSAVRALTRFEVERGGPYDEALPFEDYDLWLRTARLYPIAYEPGALITKRVLSTSLYSTTSTLRADENLARTLAKHTGITPTYDRIIDRRMRKVAARMYQGGADPIATRFALRRALRAGPTPRLIAYAVAAHLGISHRDLRAFRTGAGGSRPGATRAATAVVGHPGGDEGRRARRG